MKIKTGLPRWRMIFCLGALLCLSACHKQSGEAIVLSKEHIDAAPLPPTTPVATAIKEEPARPADDDEVEAPPLRPGEITVDQYVMQEKDRGTSRDPRALTDEQWLVRVRLREGGRTFKVHATRPQFDKVKEGDQVRVIYQVGKYTGTVWGSEIVDD